MKFKKILKHLLLLCLLIGLSLLYGFSLQRNSQKKIVDISVNFEAGDNNFLTHNMVNKLLIQNNETVKNKAKSILDLYSLENNILKNPYVEKAAVFYTVNGMLKTVVKQREPIARIVSKNSSYYIDKQGVKVPLSDVFSARVLLISGVKKDQEIKEILPFVKVILKDDFFKKEIVGIHKSAENEFVFSVRSGDYKIDFGNLEDIEVKFKKLKAFYNTTYKNKTIQNYKTITVKYHNQVVCTK
ncbi:MAG: cell division protein FtsQ [Polaribacter sp.]